MYVEIRKNITSGNLKWIFKVTFSIKRKDEISQLHSEKPKPHFFCRIEWVLVVNPLENTRNKKDLFQESSFLVYS